MLDELLQRVRGHSPRILETDRQHPQAAVLVPLTRSDDPELVLTLRASGLSTHGGEVAFPGGRRDATDPDLAFTAMREAEEEVGLPPGLVEIVGPLSPLVSRFGIHVTPYVGVVPDYVEYRANDDEIASVFSVPLRRSMIVYSWPAYAHVVPILKRAICSARLRTFSRHETAYSLSHGDSRSSQLTGKSCWYGPIVSSTSL